MSSFTSNPQMQNAADQSKWWNHPPSSLFILQPIPFPKEFCIVAVFMVLAVGNNSCRPGMFKGQHTSSSSYWSQSIYFKRIKNIIRFFAMLKLDLSFPLAVSRFKLLNQSKSETAQVKNNSSISLNRTWMKGRFPRFSPQRQYQT